MEYAKIENNIIKELISASEKPESGDWRKVDVSVFGGSPGMDQRMVDWKTGKLRPEGDLIKDGLVQDNRGDYWHKESREQLKIEAVGQKIPPGFVDKKPPESAFASWDEKNHAWVVDTKADKEAKLQKLRLLRRSEFQTFDKYQMGILNENLTEKQKQDFSAWRKAWLDAPATGKEPKRPSWFREL